MAKGINKAIIVGRLGKDPEVRRTPGGMAVCNVTVATEDVWTDKGSGERQTRTEWHRITFFGRLAEVVGEYLHKGAQVYVEGSLQTRKWEKDGIERYTTEIIANQMQMLGGGGQSAAQGQQGNGSGPGRARESEVRSPQQSSAAPNNSFDDDIPF